ncbi:MAG: Crp/Fnr family transcriptional regulator [Pseudomonadota bacterium]
MNVDKRRLASVDLFRDLSNAALAKIARGATLIELAKGEEIALDKEPGLDFFVVLEGDVSISIYRETGREVMGRFVEAGDYFCEISSLIGTPLVGHAVARTPSLLVQIARADFMNLLDAKPAFARRILQGVAEKAGHMALRVSEISALPVRRRIHLHLLRIAKPDCADGKSARITSAPTQETIASLVGTHREAVAREMADLKRAGVLDYKRGWIQIKDVARLQKLSDQPTI